MSVEASVRLKKKTLTSGPTRNTRYQTKAGTASSTAARRTTAARRRGGAGGRGPVARPSRRTSCPMAVTG
ncbi:hypothetical protein GCM10022251_23330 [Phytohabitans flavus]|uniref:Uncharacterized protein n=1 Tax=Phytohabitans flavus TaxID=1076124 RepID=A0A6F8XRR5_9ACTN|nr:hypothetical protein Pflav_028890 [Phytohabitans flavus]